MIISYIIVLYYFVFNEATQNFLINSTSLNYELNLTQVLTHGFDCF